jgi:ubiquinone/menaquinone biosynthesis C-methylase UbiE
MDRTVSEKIAAGAAEYVSYTSVAKVLEGNIHHGYWQGLSRSASVTEAADAMTRLLRSRVAARGPKRILDLGCGVGGPAIGLLAETDATVTGVSITRFEIEMADTAVRAAGLADRADFHFADVIEMPFPESSFDAVHALEFMYQIPDRAAAVHETGRVLEAGGWFHSTDFFLREPVSTRNRAVFDDFVRVAGVQTITGLDEYVAELARSGLAAVDAVDITEDVWPTLHRHVELLAAARDELSASMGEAAIDELIDVTTRVADTPEIGYLLLSARKSAAAR